MNTCPKTKDEYWQLVENNKSVLQGLIADFHPYYRRKNLKYKITAQGAEKACESIRKEIAEKEQKDPQVLFTEYVKNKDPHIVSLFNQTWFGMPESHGVRSKEGFFELCDLCSEGYLLEEVE